MTSQASEALRSSEQRGVEAVSCLAEHDRAAGATDTQLPSDNGRQVQMQTASRLVVGRAAAQVIDAASCLEAAGVAAGASAAVEEVGCPPNAADAAVVTMELATRQVIIKELALHQAASTTCGAGPAQDITTAGKGCTAPGDSIGRLGHRIPPQPSEGALHWTRQGTMLTEQALNPAGSTSQQLAAALPPGQA